MVATIEDFGCKRLCVPRYCGHRMPGDPGGLMLRVQGYRNMCVCVCISTYIYIYTYVYIYIYICMHASFAYTYGETEGGREGGRALNRDSNYQIKQSKPLTRSPNKFGH